MLVALIVSGMVLIILFPFLCCAILTRLPSYRSSIQAHQKDIIKLSAHIQENIVMQNSHLNYELSWLQSDNQRRVSRGIVSRAESNPIAYIVKYFRIPIEIETIDVLQDVLESWRETRQTAPEIWKEWNALTSSIRAEQPFVSQKLLSFYHKTHERALRNITGLKIGSIYPLVVGHRPSIRYLLQYVSPQQRSVHETGFLLNEDSIPELQAYIQEKLPRPKEVRGTPQIYAYRDMVAGHEGLLKVGYTERDIDTRVAEQFPIKGPYADEKPYEIVVRERAISKSGVPFSDHRVHEKLQSLGVERLQGEWFRTNAETVRYAILLIQNGG